MGLRTWLLSVGICAISSAGWAQDGGGVAPQNRAPAAPVAAQQQDIRVGDVILAPAVEPWPSDADAPTEQEEAWRPGNPQPHLGRERASTRRWYGLPTLLLDAGSAGLIGVGAIAPKSDAGILMGVGALTYVAGGPVVHLMNQHWWRFGGSLLLRGGLPIATTLLVAQGCIGMGDCADNVVTGLVLGSVAASVIDLSLLHWEAKEPKPQSSGSFVPQLALDRRSVLFGASGSF